MARIIFLLTCLAVLLSGCSSNGENVARKHLLWKVSDSNSSVYLLGSVHFADSSFYPLDSVIEDAFYGSDYLAVELDMSDDSILLEVASQSVKYATLEEGRTLDSILPNEVRYSFDSLCLVWDIPLDAFNNLKPWAVAMTLSSIGIQRMGFDPSLGIDLHFLMLAHAYNRGIIALETVEEQVNALAGTDIPDSVGVYYLKNVIREMGTLDSLIADFMRAWKTGDDSLFAATMEKESSLESDADSLLEQEINERVYISRNRKMAENISGFLKDDHKVFVVVGAAHMMGKEENVLDLLRRRGYTVEKL